METDKKFGVSIEAKPLVIGLAGFGTVGTGLVKILEESRETIIKRTGREIRIKKVLVRDQNRKRSTALPEGATYCQSVYDLINDSEIDVVVELMGGIESAQTLVTGALKAGKHVVTANKALLAERGDEIFALAAEKNLALGYEASICGGIPVVKTLQEGLAANNVSSLAGILNGTCNYILSAMSTEGMSFEQALGQAQELGFAEADPTLDIEGIDSAHKLALLIRLAWGQRYPFEKIHVEGITSIAAEDIQFAKEFGYSIKLLGHARMVDGKIEAGVFPTLVPKKYLLARVGHSYNAIRLEGSAVGSLFLHGLGAGDLPTGSAVAADLLDIARGAKPNNMGFVLPKLPEAEILPPEESTTKFYFRLLVKDQPGVMRDVTGVLAEHNISIAQAMQKGREDAVPLMFTTHKARTSDVVKAMSQIKKFSFLKGKPVYYRMMSQPKGVSR